MASAWGTSWDTSWGNSWGDTGSVTPPATPAAVVAATVSGVRRRPYRVRRQDFSSQANYELALRAALAEAKFAFRADEPVVAPRVIPRRTKPKPVPLDKALSVEMEFERGMVDASVSQELREVSEREREELEQVMLFISVIEEQW